MRRLVFIFISFIVGCSQPSDNKIVVPELHAGFYSDALDRINDELKSAPDDERLIDQKIFYCNQLDWPTTCISALDAFKEINGMTNQLVEQYIRYYEKHERYELLLEVIDKWASEYDLEDQYKETYIDCLTRLGKTTKATIELKEYLKSHRNLNAYAFASEQYLRINDTTLAALNLNKLSKLDPSNDLMWDYGKILFAIGYQPEGFEIMRSFVSKHTDDFEIQFVYARLLDQANQTSDAIKVMKPFMPKDTVAYSLVNWYRKESLWDSAGYVLQTLVNLDSTNREPIWRLGRHYEDRGWYLASIPYFEYLLELDSDDTLASQRIELIQRKIAYLQRKKFEESKISTIELQPKKIEN